VAKLTVIGYVELTLELAKEGNKWTARCLELGTAGYGDNPHEAMEVIDDLVALHLNALEDVAALKAFFKRHGIVLHKGRPSRKPRKIPVRPDNWVTQVTQPVKAAVA